MEKQIMKMFTRSLFLAASLSLSAAIAAGQAPHSASAQYETEIAKTSPPAATNTSTTDSVPVLKDYKGIHIGMSADEVREKLDHLKEKGKVQDYFVFSDQETAQVFYDQNGKVTAISVDYLGADSNAPSAKHVFGEELQAKADGSMYELRHYPAAGYWVAYNRTAGNDPIVTITIQKMRQTIER